MISEVNQVDTLVKVQLFHSYYFIILIIFIGFFLGCLMRRGKGNWL